jgi:histidine ammonia-lyase
MTHNTRVRIGPKPLSVKDVVNVSQEKSSVLLSPGRPVLKRIQAGVAYLEQARLSGDSVYGVTTGFGASVDRPVPSGLVHDLSRQITRFHRCGLGKYLSESATRAVLLVRLLSLSNGYSGVRPAVLNLLKDFINLGVLPLIPEEGSVGASGDLTPLSYVAAALMGEGTVLFQGRQMNAKNALRAIHRKPLSLWPKESLAVMNGTSVMTALACLALDRADYFERLATRITSLSVWALHGNPLHFEPDLFRLKNHPGPTYVAQRLWKETSLEHVPPRSLSHRLQDTYALRCAPHVIGVLTDAMDWMNRHIEIELNSSNDNPLVDGEKRKIMHGGHFYGGHVAFAMDGLKNAVANVADLLDRQMALLVDVRSNRGLPANLSGSHRDRHPVNHGLKALQIGTSAWTAEALKLTMPASVFSRSTECHNQDKVSMGTIAARDALRVLELSEQVAAALLLSSFQGIELRLKLNMLDLRHIPKVIQDHFHSFRQKVSFLGEDRPLDKDLRAILHLIREKKWPL